jgi:GNAT superfamily N-acetyltransferase
VQDVDDVDFGGFRCVLLFSRHKPEYPPPETYEKSTEVAPLCLGASRPPLPDLMTKGIKPVCAATIRVGNGYIEVPFFATSDNHRGKGYGRCLLEAIEKVSTPTCNCCRILALANVHSLAPAHNC